MTHQGSTAGAGTGAGASLGAGFGAKTGIGAGARTGAGLGARLGVGAGAQLGIGAGARIGIGTGAKTGSGAGARTGATCRTHAQDCCNLTMGHFLAQGPVELCCWEAGEQTHLLSSIAFVTTAELTEWVAVTSHQERFLAQIYIFRIWGFGVQG